MKHYLVVILFSILSCASQAQVPDSFFARNAPGHLNGNLLLAVNGAPVFKESFGWADWQSGARNEAESQFNLASISKIFTSTAILQLEERGKLKLNDPLQRYLPAFPYPGIQLRHLLSHTSGLPDLELFEDLIRKYPDTIISNRNIIPELMQWRKPLAFQPGNKWEYCNLGFELLAMVIEKVSGIGFSAYLDKYIFRPAGMTHTYVKGKKVTSRPVTLHVYPNWYTDQYTTVDSVRRYRYTAYNCSGSVGGSDVFTTTGDLLQFDKAFFSGRLLAKALVEKALTPVVLNNGKPYISDHMDTMQGEGTGSYGLGWEIFQQRGRGKSVGHGGFKYGIATFYFHDLDRCQTIIAFDNGPGDRFGELITSAALLLNHQPPLTISSKKSLARTYGTLLVNEGAESAIATFAKLKSDTAHYYLSEQEMNWLGYDLMYAPFQDHLSLCLETFRLNTLLFPDSFNVYDSYAEILRKSGKLKEAVMMYRESLRLKPDNEGGKAALQEMGKL
ncbi:serine hydrolase domain-containing protein [Chitinophaga arvensicola]|uniref:CubicO group peptidase, beta-lactamase class C family n=1 Tax=Chitinophaga arvensicola TaxID=29529 RepID=A0A1I0S9X5_9BACT|nr:serine hydrolase domain-containing protein [Chitinophaga arvensicola]SEW53017.1 CubicO group peptidase, beta-lactamase class C family [Chitinophaga arvensicola]